MKLIRAAKDPRRWTMLVAALPILGLVPYWILGASIPRNLPPVALICTAFLAWLVTSLKKGRYESRQGSYSKCTEPGKYWGNVIVLAAFNIIFLIVYVTLVLGGGL